MRLLRSAREHENIGEFDTGNEIGVVPKTSERFCKS